eukprot:jgi/Mesvir1/26430/Mv16118-RA.2
MSQQQLMPTGQSIRSSYKTCNFLPSVEANMRKASLSKSVDGEVAHAPELSPAQAKKLEILQQTFLEINKKHGENTIQPLRRHGEAIKPIEVIPTGSLGLDAALGVGGLPLGRMVEIYGPEASGKTTLALHVIAEAQKLGGHCVYVDMEHAVDISYAESLGVDPYNVSIVQPDSGDQALEVADQVIRSHAVSVVVIDSVASLVPQAELQREHGESTMAVQARLMNAALRKLTPSVASSRTLLIFINQLRHKLSTFGGGFGAPAETTPGGLGLKYNASVRLDIRRIGLVKKGDEVIGSQVRVKVSKNKVAAPHASAEFEIDNGRGPDGNKGISKASELIDLAVQYEVLAKSGTWFKYKGANLGQGKEKVKELLAARPELYTELMEQVREFIKKPKPQIAGVRARPGLLGSGGAGDFGDEEMDEDMDEV